MTRSKNTTWTRFPTIPFPADDISWTTPPFFPFALQSVSRGSLLRLSTPRGSCYRPDAYLKSKDGGICVLTQEGVAVAYSDLVDTSKVPEVPVHQTTSGLGLANVDKVVLQSVVEVVGVDRLALQKTTLNPAHLTAALLVDEEPRAELLRLDLQEASQLLQVHGGVELQVGADGRVVQGVLNLIHEDGGVVVNRVDVEGRVLEVGRSGADELGAGRTEELLEQRKGLGATMLQAVELLAVLLTQGGVDGVIQASGVESDTDGDESVHLVVLLGDGIVAVATLLEVLGPGNVDQDVAEHADGIGIATHHHVGETDIVVGGEVGRHNTGEHGLLVHLDVVESLEGKAEVTQQTVDTQESNDGEVSQHLVQRAGAILSGKRQGVLTTLDGSQLLVDLRPLDEGVEDVQHGVATPRVRVLTEKLGLLLVGAAASDTVAVAAERFELVDELVDDIPGPVVLLTIKWAS